MTGDMFLGIFATVILAAMFLLADWKGKKDGEYWEEFRKRHFRI